MMGFQYLRKDINHDTFDEFKSLESNATMVASGGSSFSPHVQVFFHKLNAAAFGPSDYDWILNRKT